MKTLPNVIWLLRIWQDDNAQDMIEYALMACLIADAAAATMSIGNIFGTVSSAVTAAGSRRAAHRHGALGDPGMRKPMGHETPDPLFSPTVATAANKSLNGYGLSQPYSNRICRSLQRTGNAATGSLELQRERAQRWCLAEEAAHFGT
jgi:Flp pilus assembly pilin Flp